MVKKKKGGKSSEKKKPVNSLAGIIILIIILILLVIVYFDSLKDIFIKVNDQARNELPISGILGDEDEGPDTSDDYVIITGCDSVCNSIDLNDTHCGDDVVVLCNNTKFFCGIGTSCSNSDKQYCSSEGYCSCRSPVIDTKCKDIANTQLGVCNLMCDKLAAKSNDLKILFNCKDDCKESRDDAIEKCTDSFCK
ncbi:hypothetical protein GOV14_00445 [Candidatus Pacearchaeota archaeon]|nr:hypothetical protein [Candidatus Pacearchaeota archaeon]